MVSLHCPPTTSGPSHPTVLSATSEHHRALPSSVASFVRGASLFIMLLCYYHFRRYALALENKKWALKNRILLRITDDSNLTESGYYEWPAAVSESYPLIR